MMSIRRSRKRGQAMALGAVAMVAMVGFLAFVIDAGMFFMIRRELQNTADAAALAGAAFLEKQTNNPLPPNGDVLNVPPLTPQCTGGLGLTSPSPEQLKAAQIACTYGFQNAVTAGKLCLGPVQMDTPTFGKWPPKNISPTIVVNFHCEAGYSFGRIISGLTNRQISASAEAALGLRESLTCLACTSPSNVTDFIIDFPWGPTPPGYMRATRLINN